MLVLRTSIFSSKVSQCIFKFYRVLSQRLFKTLVYRGPLLERPGNLTGPKSYFEIKVTRKVGCVLTSNKVLFVYLADTFPVQLSKLLKLPSGMENKTT